MGRNVIIELAIKTSEAGLAADAAFALFTDRIGAWWPKPIHARSVHESNSVAVNISIEPRVGVSASAFAVRKAYGRRAIL